MTTKEGRKVSGWKLAMFQSDPNIRKVGVRVVGLSKSEQIILHASTGSYLSSAASEEHFSLLLQGRHLTVPAKEGCAMC